MSITVSKRAVKKLKDELIQKCLSMGLGYRIADGSVESSQAIFNMMVDKEHPGDVVSISNGIKIFLDPEKAVLLKDYELDCLNENNCNFCLKKK